MANLVKLLPHQANLVQAPYVFPHIRFFALIAGYASGKTSALVYCILYAVKTLLGKKDKEGHNPKVMIGSKNLTFMKKTLTGLLEQDLKDTNSTYNYDKAHNIITIGNVELLLVPVEDESNIYGYCFEGSTLITTKRGEVPIKEVKEGDYVLTTQGFKRVKRAGCTGVKDCIKVTVDDKEIICTPEHHFIDIFNNNIKAKDLTKTTSLVKLNTKEWQKWSNMNGLIDRNLKLLTSMVSDTTDTLNLNLMEKGVITPVQMRTRRKVIQLCTEICGWLSTGQFQKGMMCTTKTETLLTILLRTLNLLRGENTLRSIGNFSLKRNGSKLLQQLKKLRNVVKNCGRIKNGQRTERNSLKRLYKVNNTYVSARLVEINLQRMLKELVSVLNDVKKTSEMQFSEKNLGQEVEKLQEFVKSAKKSFRQTNTQNLQLAHLTAKTSDVVGQYEVYDIEVEDCHEFFANGVRVHNSVTLVVIDELDELDTQTAMAVVKSSNDRCRQQIEGWRSPAFIFCTSSQGLKGTYQTIMHFKKSGIGYVLMRARTRDNIYLPKDYVESMYSIYNETERKCLLEGEFVSIDSGLVFPDYNPEKNKLDVDLYEHCRDSKVTIYIGQDFNGFGNNAVAFAILSGAIVAIKDYEFPDIRRAPEVFRYDFPENEIVWIPDMTYKEHFIEFKKELRLFNIKIAYRSCNPLVGDRNFACNKLFVAEHLFICPMCKGLETTLMTWQKDPKTGAPSKGGKGAPDHKGDCLGYVVHYLLSWKRELKPLYAVTLERLYEARRARGANASELEITSTTLDPSRLKGIVLKQAPNTVAADA